MLNRTGRIFYRYNFLTLEHELDDVLTVETVQLIHFFMVQFTPKIISFCNNEATFAEIIEQTEKALGKPLKLSSWLSINKSSSCRHHLSLCYHMILIKN